MMFFVDSFFDSLQHIPFILIITIVPNDFSWQLTKIDAMNGLRWILFKFILTSSYFGFRGVILATAIDWDERKEDKMNAQWADWFCSSSRLYFTNTFYENSSA